MKDRIGGVGRPGAWLRRGMAAILDMDGVIVDSNPFHARAWAEYNHRFGIETNQAMVERMYGRRNDDIVRDFFGGLLGPAEIAAHGAAKEHLYRDLIRSAPATPLVAGVREFLARHAGAPLALATNAEPANVNFLLDWCGLRHFFSVVVDGHQVRNPKPHPEAYLTAARELAVSPANCVVFEDSVAGVESALAAGMRTVGIRTTHNDLPGVALAVDSFLSPELESWLRTQEPVA